VNLKRRYQGIQINFITFKINGSPKNQGNRSADQYASAHFEGLPFDITIYVERLIGISALYHIGDAKAEKISNAQERYNFRNQP